MLTRWGYAVIRVRRIVLLVAVLVALIGGVWGTGVFSRLVTGGFEDPGSESAHAAARISRTFGGQDADVLVLYSKPPAKVADSPFRAAIEAKADQLRRLPGVAGVSTTYTGTPGLVSRDERSTYVVIRLRAIDDSGKRAEYSAVKSQLAIPGFNTQVGGTVAINDRIDAKTKDDVSRGEMVAMPIVLVLLVLIFGGVVAASIPLLVGLLSVMGALTVVRLVTLTTDVSTFAINTVTVLGLGMAIDYSLLMISRFRTELRAGQPVDRAVVRTMATAGRTVIVSGSLVVLSLASLLIFPEVFLRSMAFGGMAAVAVAVLGSLTALPAALSLLGHKVNALRVPLPALRHNRQADGSGAWRRLAEAVMRRPIRYAAAVVAVLGVLAAPLLHVQFGSVDQRVLPTGDPARAVSEQIAQDFPGRSAAPIQVLVEGADSAEVGRVLRDVRTRPNVTGASVIASRGTSTLISADYPGGYAGRSANAAVREIRALPAPPGATILVGGDSATIRDQLTSLGDRLPWMLLLMALVTFAVLLIAFGSVLLPLKAVLTNVISVAATFGALVWVFQYGHLASAIGATTTGHLEPTVLIFVMAILFGLAADYEVFLLSRVREEWDATGDNTLAVGRGLQRTGGIITAAAVLLIVVTGGFATGDIVITKLIGIGTALGIFLDATLVRALLVPATMRLLGRWNWWAPGAIGRIHRAVNLEGEPPQLPASSAGVLSEAGVGR